jgi:hypothetical protein
MFQTFNFFKCEQLTFFNVFVEQLQCEQLIIFGLKISSAQNDFLGFFQAVSFFWNLLEQCLSIEILVSSSFLEQMNFEQLILLLFNFKCTIIECLISRK